MAGNIYHLGLGVLLALGAPAFAQGEPPRPAPLYDPEQLPAFHGRVQLFTPTLRGDIDGFVMTDGTEVKTPPHLTLDIAAALKPGDAVTIHGLKAASLPLIRALSVRNDATGVSVIDTGPDPDHPPAPPPDAPETGAAASIVLSGRIRMTLHGPRGDVNGVLLEDGTILQLPPPDAARLAALLVGGQTITAEGRRRTMRAGTLVELTAIGPQGGALVSVGRRRLGGDLPTKRSA